SAAGMLASLRSLSAFAASTDSCSRDCNRLQHARVPFGLLLRQRESETRRGKGLRDVGGPGEVVASRIFVFVGEFGFHGCIVFAMQSAFCAFEYIRLRFSTAIKKGPERALRALVLRHSLKREEQNEHPYASCLAIQSGSVRGRTLGAKFSRTSASVT